MKNYISYSELSETLLKFARERGWEKFHSPKNLASATSAEVGELNEIFQWLSEEESIKIKDSPEKLTAASHEIADVLMYLVRLSDVLGLDLNKAVQEKIEVNAQKYPAQTSDSKK